MTEPVPDWAINVPPTRSVHTIPIRGEGGQGVDTSAMLTACRTIFESRAFSAGLMEDGAGAEGGPTGEVLQGSQNFVDALCGFALGGASTGTSPQTVIDGVSDTNNQVTDNPFVSDLMGMGGSQPNQILGLLCGLRNLLGLLCGIGTGSTDISATTPTSVLDTVQATASTGHLMLAGQSNPAATGTAVLGAAQTALLQNTANHVRSQAQSTAQSVVVKQENLLISQAFTNAYDVAIDPDGDWVWNGADGAVTLGCLQATANGTQLDYVSNEIPVVAGENITLSCFAKCVGIAYTGTNPVRFGVQKYRAGKNSSGATFLDVGGYDVDTLASPAATTGWLELAGTYTVPPGVDQLRFRFSVAATATAGTIKFDEANFLKTDLIADEAVPGVGITVDNIVTNLYGTAGEGFTHNAAAVALANTASALVSTASRIAALEAEGHTGAIAGDDFNWVGEITANANWGGSYSGEYLGTYVADGVDAAFSAWPNLFGFNNTMRFDWQGEDEESGTDYQLIQVVLDSAPTTSEGYKSAIHLHGRIASDWSSFVRAEFVSDGTWALKSYASGVFTTIDSGTCTVPGAGSTLSLYCGDVNATAPRHFKLQVGTTVITDLNEVGTASQYGASNRKWGWGGYAEGGLYLFFITFLPANGVPPKVNQWLGLDQ